MTSLGHSSDKDFLESLAISLDINLTADADTYVSVTGIYAQDPHIRLDVGETSVAEIPVKIFDHNNPVGEIIRPSHLDYLRHFDVGIDLARIVGPGSTTPVLSADAGYPSRPPTFMLDTGRES
ncbi:hypothetical protein JCGZ_03546 [Jatropha curcas]|uniref:Uncharacterized protein n=1 Tax=Jatropha curcas TaxID=180498 RepID=A0A067JDE1_JATCU|nr:hypothetical protein JCGZ_03546 [Jatropha curcas]